MGGEGREVQAVAGAEDEARSGRMHGEGDGAGEAKQHLVIAVVVRFVAVVRAVAPPVRFEAFVRKCGVESGFGRRGGVGPGSDGGLRHSQQP